MSVACAVRSGCCGLLAARISALVLLLLFSGASVAHASPKSVLFVTPAAADGADSLDSQVHSALTGQLRELTIEVTIAPAPTSRAPLSSRANLSALAASARAFAVTWVQDDASKIRIYLYDAAGHHLYVREVVPSGSATSLAEEIAVVLRSAISALSEGEAVGMTEVELKTPSPVPAPAAASRLPPPARDEHVLRLRAGYSGTLLVRGQKPQHGVAFGVAAGIPNSALYAGLGYTYFTPLELSSSRFHSDLQRHPVEAFLGAEMRLGKALLVVEGALMGDAIARTTTWTTAGLAPTQGATRWIWAASTRLALALPLAPRFRLRFGVGSEFVLNRYSQAIREEDGRSEIVTELLRARPRWDAGAEFVF